MCRCGGELLCLVTVWRRIVNPGYVLVKYRELGDGVAESGSVLVSHRWVAWRYRYDVTCPVPVKYCGERVGCA